MYPSHQSGLSATLLSAYLTAPKGRSWRRWIYMKWTKIVSLVRSFHRSCNLYHLARRHGTTNSALFPYLPILLPELPAHKSPPHSHLSYYREFQASYHCENPFRVVWRAMASPTWNLYPLFYVILLSLVGYRERLNGNTHREKNGQTNNTLQFIIVLRFGKLHRGEFPEETLQSLRSILPFAPTCSVMAPL